MKRVFASSALVLFFALPLAAQSVVVDTGATGGSSSRVLAQSPQPSPVVTILPFTVPGVSIGSALSTASTLSAPPASLISHLLPYSVLIKNDDSKSIIGYSVCWTTTGSEGFVSRSYQLYLDTIMLKGLIHKETTDIVSPVGLASSIPASPSQALIDEIGKQYNWLKDQTLVQIHLDAIVFEDGTVIGQDLSRSGLRMKTALRSEFDLLQRLTVSQKETADQIVSLLTSIIIMDGLNPTQE